MLLKISFSAYALGNVYSENSGCVSKDGKLMFGSNYGLVVITPGKIVNNSTVTPMAALPIFELMVLLCVQAMWILR